MNDHEPIRTHSTDDKTASVSVARELGVLCATTNAIKSRLDRINGRLDSHGKTLADHDTKFAFARGAWWAVVGLVALIGSILAWALSKFH